MSELGLYLRYLRENHNFSLNDVYLKTDIRDSTLSRIENGSTEEPSPIALKKLAILYNVNVIDIFIKAGFLNRSDLLEYQKVFHNIDLLNEEEKSLFQHHINLLTKYREDNERS